MRALDPSELTAVQTACEIGPGSGYVSLYVRNNAPHLEQIDLVDLSDSAIACAREVIKDRRATYAVGDGREFLVGKKYGLVYCNPPYILRPKSIDDNPYEGICLLVYLVTHADEFLNKGGRLVTNVSSLAEPVTTPLFADTGIRTIDQMHVPLKVFNVLNNPEWMDYLLSEKGLRKESRDGYDYWHTISIAEVRKR
ncbi:MAG TPA: methyltransferase [Candidatus Nanoarchaeia archaeon]|nr:methyltransferase [Candidatus Nanoarchaeia archaeon]